MHAVAPALVHPGLKEKQRKYINITSQCISVYGTACESPGAQHWLMRCVLGTSCFCSHPSLFILALTWQKLIWPFVLSWAGIELDLSGSCEGTQPGQPTQTSQRDIPYIGRHAKYINWGNWLGEGLIAWERAGHRFLRGERLHNVSFTLYAIFII